MMDKSRGFLKRKLAKQAGIVPQSKKLRLPKRTKEVALRDSTVIIEDQKSKMKLSR